MPRDALQARPTLYKGIQMRSRLEALYAAGFDYDGLDWDYEPMAFADETGQYLPDFVLRAKGFLNEYWEVKGLLDRDDLPIVQRRMEIIWTSEPDATLVLVVGSYDDSLQWIVAPGGSWVSQDANVA